MRRMSQHTLPVHLVTVCVATSVMLSACSSNSSKIQALYVRTNQHVKVDKPYHREIINTIKPGVTTRYQVLELFGPPTAIARKGSIMTMPPPGHLKSGFIEVNSDTFFEPFALKFENTENHIVYYYYHPPFWNSESRLWVYINETTNIVDDYFFKPPHLYRPPAQEETEKEEKENELEEDLFE